MKCVRSLRVVVKADSATEFCFLPRIDPITRKQIPEVSHHTNADVIFGCDVGQCPVIRQSYDQRIAFLNDLGKIALAPLHEQRKLLAAIYPGLGEQVLHFLRMISFIDHEYFGDGPERLAVDSDMERYAKAFFTALLSVNAIRQIEQRFYRLDDENYDVHFDLCNREVIISKSVPRGIRGWLLSKTRRGYGIDSWRKVITIGDFH